MIECVLFDLDGVLLDAREIHYQALNLALVESGYGPINRADHEARFDGLPTKTKLELLKVPSSVARLKQQHTIELLQDLPPKSKAELMGLPCLIGVCTNAVRRTLEIGIEKCGLYPEVSLCNEDVVRNKPDPEIYLKAMAILGVKPEETLIVEDSTVGIEAARRAGAFVLQVSGVDEVTKRRVDEFVDSCAGGWARKTFSGRRIQRPQAVSEVSRQDDDRACSGEYKAGLSA